MMRKTGLVLMIFFACSFPHVNAQTGTKWPSTMLWRISGNNLQQPSYLFGTIHLQDKELFHFGDSVYRALSGVQGFAMEINPYEMMDLVMEQVINKDDEEEDNDNEGPRKPPPPPGSKKNLGKSRLRIMPAYRKSKGGQMSTIVDLYLYETARTQGKWMGGLEDVNDHIGYIMDETGSRAETNKEYEKPPVLNMRDSMVSWYVKQDLDRLYRAFEKNGQFDTELNTRNAVMVRMADSLSHIRSTFFAVGTAHLPGEKGMITLLREQGFTVTPVFSSKKIEPKPLVSNPDAWPEIYEADSSYSYRMPYAPKLLKQDKTGVDMKISFDLAELMGYFFFSITDQTAGINASGTYLIDRMLKNYQSKRNKLRDTRHGQYMGHPSLTATIKEEDNEVRMLLVQDHNTLYVMMASTEQNKNFKEERINFFFNSLRINKQPTVKPVSWVSYTDTANGYTITSPCQVKLKKLAGEDSTRVRLFNMCSDSYTNTQYGITVVKMNPGYYSLSDTSFLERFSSEMEYMAKDKKITVTRLTIQGYPAATYELMDENGLNYLFRVIIKGGIMYTVVTAGSDVHAPASMRFHESFRLNDPAEDHWKKQVHPDGNITLFAPAPFEPVNPEENDAGIIEKPLNYYSFDPETATSYYLFKTPYNPYQWYKNDSAWVADIMPANNMERDSIISKKFYYESGRPVLELVKTCNMLNTWKHFKIFVAGDTMYELQSHITTQQYQSATHRRMYGNIEWKKELPVTIFENKNRLILEDLVTADSLKFETAKEALGLVSFAPGELPLLHEALLKKYLPEDSAAFSLTVNRALMNALLPLADSSTLNFVQQHYKNIPADINLKQEDLLYLLAKMKTSGSMHIFKELLIEHTPVKPGYRYLPALLRDSLPLSVQLFPEMNRLLPDTNYQFLIISLANELIDSALLSVSVLDAAQKDIYAIARAELNRFTLDSTYYFSDLPALFGLLVKLKTPEALEILNEYARLNKEFVLYRLFYTQLQEKIPVNTVVLKKLAASDYYRIDAYRELKERKLEKQFPPVYATQQAIARSLMFNYNGEDEDADWDIKKVQFVKELTASYKGRPCRFFVFKVQILVDDKLSWYTGFSGPFENDRKKLLPVTKYGSEWVDFDDTYSPANIPQSFISFKAILRSLEEENE